MAGALEGRTVKRRAALFAAAAAVQLALAALPDTMGDLLFYRLWTRDLAGGGLAEGYWPTSSGFHPPVDYPPVFPYLLRGMGAVLPASALANDRLLDFAIRVPLVAANLGLGALIARASTTAAALFLFNPAVLFHTCYWGQTDALWTLLVLASLVMLAGGRVEWAAALIAAACLTKPLAYPYAAVVLATVALRSPLRRAARAAGAAALTVALLLAPFAVVHRLGPLLRALAFQIDAMPYATVNAHNLWWLLGAGLPWREARGAWIGPLAPATVGIVLFVAFLGLTVIRLRRSQDPRALPLACAGVALGFFVLSTHMHENHLFAFLPLVASLGLEDRRLRAAYLLVSATFLANMVLHDPYLGSLLGAHVPGPTVTIRQPVEQDPAAIRYLATSGYGHLLDELTRPTSVGWIVLTVANSAINVAVFVWWIATFLAPRSFDAALGQDRRPRRPTAVAAVA
jgi:Gpi18-like mannosyltransferase